MVTLSYAPIARSDETIVIIPSLNPGSIMTSPEQFWQKEEFERILDSLRIGILHLDMDWRYRYVNEMALQHRQQTKEQLIGRSIFELDPTFEGTDRHRMMQECLNGKKKGEIEIVIGSRWLQLLIEPIPDGVLVVSFDITHRKEAEQALLRSERRFSTAFRSSPLGMALSRLSDGTFFEVNDEACRIYGYSRSEIIGKTSIELGLIDAPTRERLVSDIYGQNRLRAADLTMHSGTGEDVQVIFSWDKITLEEEECVLATILDVTERNALEQQNLRLQRLESIGALAGGIVHDLNNVLGPITLSLGALRRKLTDERDLDMVDLIHTNSKRAADLGKQILMFARGAEHQRAPVRVERLVDEVVRMLRPVFATNIILEHPRVKDLPEISADPTQIHQILMNLAVNARDAMPGGGKIRFLTEKVLVDAIRSRMDPQLAEGEYVLLSVVDTGTGIPADVIDRIFDPFFTTKEKGKGTGLGLTTVLSIIKSHDGLLRVSSEPGRGTRFDMYLPSARTAAPAEQQHQQREVDMGRGEQILFVDDDATVREVARLTLESGGYSVLTAEDGAVAVATYGLHQQTVALVITDMDMPQMDGTMLVSILRKMRTDLPIIGSTGTPDELRMEKFRSSGISAFLMKPFTADAMLRSIHAALKPPRDDAA